MYSEKKDLIFLVGFMGSGKTTIGKKIARALKYEFSDLDQYIESVAAQSVSSLFEQQGEAHFRNLESECLHHYGQRHGMVIATGGGTPCFHDNMDWMLEHGCCVYIHMPEGALYQRLCHASPKRPLLAGKTDEELRAFIHDKLMERESYYQRSHVVIDGMHSSISSITVLLKTKVG